ncbi:MAG TPA: hypothetical protein VNM37_00815 [Candidatus Dormibacteraeota bacterium]|nr:hypothetical protein [Candidatus Dormibacteraeota bacterium]
MILMLKFRARALLVLFWLAICGAEAAGSPRQLIPLDADWLFSLAAPTNAQIPDLDDHAWRALELPHDWSIEGPFAETNRTGGAGGFLPGGIGWYRKHFALPTNAAGRRVFIEFDGVMANSEVWSMDSISALDRMGT